MRKSEGGTVPYAYMQDVFGGMIFNAPALAAGEDIELEYRFDCPEFGTLRERYPIERIAGKGGDFQRALRLCRYLAPRLRHESDYDNHVPCNSLDLLDYCFEKQDVGINCLNKAKILAECCLALGIYARRVGGMPCSPYDGDNHVVTEIFDRGSGKWAALDPTYGSYFSDGMKPLDCRELRAAFGEGGPVSAVLNRQTTGNMQSLQRRNASVNWYYAKNSYWFSFDTVSAFGVPERSERVYVAPAGFDVRRWIDRNEAYRAERYGGQPRPARALPFRLTSPSVWDSPIG